MSIDHSTFWLGPVAFLIVSAEVSGVASYAPPTDFSATAWHIFDALVAVLAGGLAGGLATRFIVEPYKSKMQRELARVESDLATEQDERKALRDALEAERAKRFGLLHEWRAKAMSETYAASCDLEDAHDAFSKSFGGFIGGRTPKDYWLDLTSAGKEFRKAFWTKRILFGRGLAEDLTVLNRAYVEISNTYLALYAAAVNGISEERRTDDVLRGVEYDVLSNILTSDRYREVIDRIDSVRCKIEEQFRKIFGVTDGE